MVKKCPECNHYISDTVSVCPHCGYSINSEESSTEIHEDEFSQDNVGRDELVNQDNETIEPVNYEIEEPQQVKKNYIPIILGCILVIGIIIGIIGFSSEEDKEPPAIVSDSIVAVVDSVIEEPIIETSFSTIPVSYGKETDDINTEVSIDFPQTNNEILQESVVSFIVRALTDDFIGVKMRFRTHFLCKIGTKLHSRARKVLNGILPLKNRPKCRVFYNLVEQN
jgi:hypothetical protein